MNFKSNSRSFFKGQVPWNKGIKKFVDMEVIKNLYFNEGKSCYDISKLFNVSEKTIRNRLKEKGFILRKNTEPSDFIKNKIRQKVISNYNNLSKEEKNEIGKRLSKNAGWNKGLKGVQEAWNKGIPKTKEQIEKQRQSIINHYKTHPETKELIKKSRAKQIFPKKDSSIELKIQDYLKQLGIEFFTHQYMNIKHSYQCDIFIPSLNTVVECDGVYWHKYPTRRDIDNIRTKELIDNGFRVIRLWEFEINKMTIDKFNSILNRGDNYGN